MPVFFLWQDHERRAFYSLPTPNNIYLSQAHFSKEAAYLTIVKNLREILRHLENNVDKNHVRHLAIYVKDIPEALPEAPTSRPLVLVTDTEFVEEWNLTFKLKWCANFCRLCCNGQWTTNNPLGITRFLGALDSRSIQLLLYYYWIVCGQLTKGTIQN